MSRQKWTRYTTAALTAGAMAISVSGCGGLSKSGATAGGSSTGTSPTSGTSASGASGLLAKCTGMLTEASKPLTFTAPGPKLDPAPLRGKTIQIVTLSMSITAVADATAAIQQASKDLGITVQVFDSRADVGRMQQGIAQGVSQHVGGIILLGIPTALTGPSIKTAADAGIPAVAVLNNEPQAGQPGQGAGENIFATAAPSYSEGGQWQACKAVLDTGGKANVVIFGSKELSPSAAGVAGIRSILSDCAGCTVDENSTPAADWQTRLPGLAQSVVKKNPSVNYLIALYDNMSVFMSSGVRISGASNVHVTGFNGSAAALKLVQQGPTITADPGQSSGWVGYAALDQAMRGMLKMAPADPKVPSRFLDAENLKAVDVTNETAVYGDAYVAGYRALWGLS